MGLVLTIGSSSAGNVLSDSEIQTSVRYIFISATKIERADPIWCSHTPPILLAVGGFISTGSIDHHPPA